MTSFYQDVITKDPRFHNTQAVHDINLLEPITRAAALAIVADAKTENGIDLGIFETYRSKERQAMLFAQGATKLKTVGVHHYGLACDFVKLVGNQPSWKGSFDFLLPLCHKHGLVSGINWGQPNVKHTFIDSGHAQRITLMKQNGLFAGSWYPDAAYDPYKDGAK